MKNITKRLAAILLAAAMTLAVSCKESSSDADDVSKKDESSQTTTSEPDSSSETESSGPDEPDSSEPDSSEDDSSGGSAQTQVRPALWKIETESGAEVYFTGTMHALPEDAYPLPDKIMEVYESSDAIAVECDVVAYSADFQAQIELAEQLMYTDGSSIKDHLGEDIYNALVSKMKEWNIYMSAYDFYKPAMWESLIEEFVTEKSGLSSDKGFDMYFLNAAKSDSKEIIEVETAEFQMDMLINFSDDIYKLLLGSYADFTEQELVDSMTELYNTWASGDIEALGNLDQDTTGLTDEEIQVFQEYNKIMLYDRNKGMADKLIELSKGDKNVFFMVGAAHYPGEGGILQLLDQAGVKYERIEY